MRCTECAARVAGPLVPYYHNKRSAVGKTRSCRRFVFVVTSETSLPKVICQDGRVAALWHTYAL